VKLIIHTGHGKTGSTSIQSTLRKNKVFLQQNKIFYTGLNFEFLPIKTYDWQKPYGWPELSVLSQSDFDEQLFNVIFNALNEFKKQGYKKIVWSNESLFPRIEMLRTVIEKLQESFDVETVTFIRRHDKWLKSAYFQWGVKHKTYLGVVKSFMEWTKSGVRYSNEMKAWERLNSSKCSFINFDECGDASETFVRLLGFKNKELTTIRINETPNDIELAMYALYNSLFIEQKMPNELGSLLSTYEVNKLQVADVNIKEIFPTKQQLADAFLGCENDLKEVNAIFKDHGEPVFAIEDGVKNSKVPDITSDKMIAVLIHIMNEQNKKIQLLNNDLENLKSIVSK
jgi:hypothetical protein